MKLNLKNTVLVAALAAASALPAMAEEIVIDMTGWQTFGEYLNELNSSLTLSLPSGSTVTGFSYSNLAFTTSNGSWRSEFVISVSAVSGLAWMDWAPSTSGSPGSFGPGMGSWNGPAGRPPITFGAGATFEVGNGPNNLFVTVYEDFDDPEGNPSAPSLLDATVLSGTLTLTYQPPPPIPEPSTYGLMALGLIGVAAAARQKRRQP